MTIALSTGLLILRLVAGLTLAAHGAQKFFGWFGGPGISGTLQMQGRLGLKPAPLWAALVILGEFGGGLSVAFGFLTPLGAAGMFAAMFMAIAKGHYADARAALRESLLHRRDQGSRSGIADSLESIAALAAAEAEPQRAIQLVGAAASIRESIGEQLTPVARTMVDEWLLPLQRTLGQDAFRSAWETGRARSIEPSLELEELALQEDLIPSLALLSSQI